MTREESWLLCFDEFHVTDIADAMIPSAGCLPLFELGVIVVATSNVAPVGALQGASIARCCAVHRDDRRRHMDVLQLTHALTFGWKSWPASRSGMCPPMTMRRKRSTRGGAAGRSSTVSAGIVVKAGGCGCRALRWAWRGFLHDLCEQPLAAADYLRIAHEFHTVIVDRIPVMGFDERNATKRSYPDRHALRQNS